MRPLGRRWINRPVETVGDDPEPGVENFPLPVVSAVVVDEPTSLS